MSAPPLPGPADPEIELADLATLPAGVVRVRDGADGWGVSTVVRHGDPRRHRDHPCKRCPFRTDAVGTFPPEVFRHSAPTTYDLAVTLFGCHSDEVEEAQICAGFLLVAADDNLAVRMSGGAYSDVHSTVELFGSYREMAIANGVDPDDPVLAPCRDDRTGEQWEPIEPDPARADRPGADD
ncbi:DUF6283 family protein [Streptosporangium sp. NPDC048047]|uniref:DUF6283 family protein n=1 Tax=Streptosporangium sp. NPDC048047 TaxID=3155748 RepID=UPI00342F5C7E